MSKITIKKLEEFECVTVSQSPRETGYLAVTTGSAVNKFITIYDDNISIKGHKAARWEVIRLLDQFKKVHLVAEIEDYGTKFARVLNIDFQPVIIDDDQEDDGDWMFNY